MTETALLNVLERIERRIDALQTAIRGKNPLMSKVGAARELGISPQTFTRRYIQTGRILLDRNKVRRRDLENLK